MLTVPDARKTGRIFKRCRICKAWKYLPLSQDICDRCQAQEPTKIDNSVLWINKPGAKEPKQTKPKQINNKVEEIRGKIRRRFWII